MENSLGAVSFVAKIVYHATVTTEHSSTIGKKIAFIHYMPTKVSKRSSLFIK